MTMIPWLKSPNLYAVLGILAIVVLIFNVGQRHEQRKVESEVAAVNKPVVEQRGKDEAEIAAEKAASAKTDADVVAALTQTCPVTEATAILLAKVR